MNKPPDNPVKLFWEKHQKNIITGLSLVMMLIVMVVARQYIFQFLEAQESELFNARQSSVGMSRSTDTNGGQNSHISVVQIGITTEMQDLFGKHPYTRDVHGYIIRFLNRTQPKMVIYNIAFALGKDKKNPEYDQFFADAIHQANYRVLTGINPSVEVPSEKEREFLKSKAINLTGLELASLLPDSTTPEGQPLDLNQVKAKLAQAGMDKSVQQNEITKILQAYMARYSQLVQLQLDRQGINMIPSLDMPYPALIESGAEFYPQQTVKSDISGTIRYARPFSTFWMYKSGCNEKLYCSVADNKFFFYPTITMAPLMDSSRTIEWTGEGGLKIGKNYVDRRGEPLPIIRWYGDARNGSVYPIINEWKIVKMQLAHECAEDPTRPVCADFEMPDKQELETLKQEEAQLLKAFKDQYVLIGFKVENFDSHKTVYGSNYPGLYINANILDNYLHNDFVKKAGAPWTVGLSVLMAALIIPFCLRRSILLSVILVLFLGGLHTYATFFVYQQMSLWLNWIYPITTLVVSAVGAILYRTFMTEKEKEELAIRVNIDPLTKLYNKGYFLETLQNQMDAAKTLNAYLGVVFIDLDHFKKLNDTYGHQFGDKVLIAAAAKAKQVAAEHNEQHICRYGGEELTAIIAGKPPEYVEEFAETMLRRIREELKFEEHPEVVITGSFGVSTFQFTPDGAHNDKTIDQVIELADQEVYRAKMNGRNQVQANRTGRIQGEVLKEPPRDEKKAVHHSVGAAANKPEEAPPVESATEEPVGNTATATLEKASEALPMETPVEPSPVMQGEVTSTQLSEAIASAMAELAPDEIPRQQSRSRLEEALKKHLSNQLGNEYRLVEQDTQVDPPPPPERHS